MKFNVLLPASEYSFCINICCRQLEKNFAIQTHTNTYSDIYILTRQGYDLHMPNTNLKVRSSLQQNQVIEAYSNYHQNFRT
jgi:hypothetical protein